MFGKGSRFRATLGICSLTANYPAGERLFWLQRCVWEGSSGLTQLPTANCVFGTPNVHGRDSWLPRIRLCGPTANYLESKERGGAFRMGSSLAVKLVYPKYCQSNCFMSCGQQGEWSGARVWPTKIMVLPFVVLVWSRAELFR